MTDANLYTLLSARFPDGAEKFAELEDGRHYTYGDLDAVTARFAATLAACCPHPSKLRIAS